MELNNTDKQILQIERACGDLRRGMAVVVTNGNGDRIIVGSPDNLSYINKLTDKSAINKLIISTTRAAYIFQDYKISTPISIAASKLSTDDIAEICSSSPSSIKLNYSDFRAATEIEESALKLAKISELIPAIITFVPTNETSDLISIATNNIDSYIENTHYSMFEACRAPLNLAYAPNAEIIAYRPNIGGAEHYAIIIGTPGVTPLVRVHSSCYTGDLLASLDCDCRDQLHSAIELMGKNDGGIILYLMQEGRGIGLVNKLRAYDLKHKGMDTVEANRALGFDDDERLFVPAAEILRKLNINSVKLLTNNPRKASGLEECGIKVAGCVPHIMQSNEHNKAYLQTKVDRLGHTA